VPRACTHEAAWSRRPSRLKRRIHAVEAQNMDISTILLLLAGWTAVSSFLAWSFFALGFGFELAEPGEARSTVPANR